MISKPRVSDFHILLSAFSVEMLAAASAFVHLQTCMPRSTYSLGLRCAFLIGMITATVGIVHIYLAIYDTNNPIRTAVSLSYNIITSLYSMAYFIAQTSFLRSIVRYNEAITDRVVLVARIVIIASTLIQVVCETLFYCVVHENFLTVVNDACIGLNSFMDMLVNGYVVVLALRRFTCAGAHLWTMLIQAWLVSVVFFITAMVIMFTVGNDIYVYMILGSVMMQFYIPLSYLCIALVRSMVVKHAVRPLSQVTMLNASDNSETSQDA